MLIGVLTGIAMMMTTNPVDSAEENSVSADGDAPLTFFSFTPFWIGLIFRYLGRKPSIEVVTQE